MQDKYLIVVSLFVGGAFGFFTAVMMMGAKVAELNDKIFFEEVKRRMGEKESAQVKVEELEEPPAHQKKTKNSQKKRSR